MVDIDLSFYAKIAVLISSSDMPDYQARKAQTLAKLQQLTKFDQIFDKNLSHADSVYQLVESQRLNLLSQKAESGQKILLCVGYIGHSVHRNGSLHTYNTSEQ